MGKVRNAPGLRNLYFVAKIKCEILVHDTVTRCEKCKYV